MTTHLEVPEVGDGEVVVRVLGERVDSFGRIRFVAYWWDGSPLGTRVGKQVVHGQYFYSRLDEFGRDSEAHGLAVRVSHPGTL